MDIKELYKVRPAVAKAAEEVDNHNRNVLREREIQGRDEIRESVKEDARRLFRAPVTENCGWKSEEHYNMVFHPTLFQRIKIFIRDTGREIEKLKRWAKNGFKTERMRRL